MANSNRFPQLIWAGRGTDAVLKQIYPYLFGELMASTDSNALFLAKSTGLGDITLVAGTRPYTIKSGNYTATSTDYHIECTTTLTITLPTAVGITGRSYNILTPATGTITIATTSSQTINGDLTLTITDQLASVVITSNGTNWRRTS